MKLQDLVPLMERYADGQVNFTVQGQQFVLKSEKRFLKSDFLTDGRYNLEALGDIEGVENPGQFVHEWADAAAKAVVRDIARHRLPEKSAAHFYVYIESVSPYEDMDEGNMDAVQVGFKLLKLLAAAVSDQPEVQSNKWKVEQSGACVSLTYLPKRAD